jgi:hypothetical protein
MYNVICTYVRMCVCARVRARWMQVAVRKGRSNLSLYNIISTALDYKFPLVLRSKNLMCAKDFSLRCYNTTWHQTKHIVLYYTTLFLSMLTINTLLQSYFEFVVWPVFIIIIIIIIIIICPSEIYDKCTVHAVPWNTACWSNIELSHC